MNKNLKMVLIYLLGGLSSLAIWFLINKPPNNPPLASTPIKDAPTANGFYNNYLTAPLPDFGSISAIILTKDQIDIISTLAKGGDGARIYMAKENADYFSMAVKVTKVSETIYRDVSNVANESILKMDIIRACPTICDEDSKIYKMEHLKPCIIQPKDSINK